MVGYRETINSCCIACHWILCNGVGNLLAFLVYFIDKNHHLADSCIVAKCLKVVCDLLYCLMVDSCLKTKTRNRIDEILMSVNGTLSEHQKALWELPLLTEIHLLM